MVVVELVGDFGRIVCDRRSGKVEDSGTENRWVGYGTGIAGRRWGGDVVHRMAEERVTEARTKGVLKVRVAKH